MTVKILKKNNYNTKKWAGGETTEIFIFPEDASLENRDFIFRISSATCPEEKSKFSDFTGYNRYITSLDETLKLINKNKELSLNPYEIFFFDGKDETYSKSKVRDFNLILKKGYNATYRTESISEKVDLCFEEGIVLIFIPEGNIRIGVGDDYSDLDTFDSVLIRQKEEITLESIDKNYTKVIIVEVEVDLDERL